jgi:CDP-diacylglycerol--serine O-phosphatidyltransferase
MAVPAAGEPLISKPEWRLALLGALVYMSCAAIRLARFNVEQTGDSVGQKKFSGLPVPGAALALIALLVLHDDVDVGVRAAGAIRLLALPMTFALGLLMVSRLDYVHVFNIYVRRRHPPSHLVWLLIIAGIAWHSPPILLVVLAYAYVLSGLVLNWRRRYSQGARHDVEEHAA